MLFVTQKKKKKHRICDTFRGILIDLKKILKLSTVYICIYFYRVVCSFNAFCVMLNNSIDLFKEF